MTEVARPAEGTQGADIGSDPNAKDRWETPEIVSFKPVSNAQGSYYRPGDGISNLS
jgi:hypothetical protein